ncbi:MAG: hypothetical protein JW818_17895 [Pirellulales bacterium]|nr:hypothetical protein [Pirellulales bacterium]
MVKDNLRATSLDTSGALLITADEIIASTEDGESYWGIRTNALVDCLSSQKPAWL